jgi:GTPase SAR1 family protein
LRNLHHEGNHQILRVKMGNRNGNTAASPAVLFAGPVKSGKSCLACAICQGGDTGTFPGNDPAGAYYATNGRLECSINQGAGALRIVENGGGSAAGLKRMNTASFSSDWGCVCLCFVVDASDRDSANILKAREMLGALSSSQPGKPIVVAAAKCDADGAMDSAEIFDRFHLQEFGEGRLFKVVATSTLAAATQGIDELLQFFKTAVLAVES